MSQLRHVVPSVINITRISFPGTESRSAVERAPERESQPRNSARLLTAVNAAVAEPRISSLFPTAPPSLHLAGETCVVRPTAASMDDRVPHRYNASLPDGVRAALPAEAATMLAEIEELGNYATSCTPVHGPAGVRFFAKLNLYRSDLKYTLDDATWVRFVRIGWQLALASHKSLSLQAKWMQELAWLLKKKHRPDAALELEWRPLYDLIESTCMQDENRQARAGSRVAHSHTSALVSLANEASRYFPDSAVADIWATLKPLLGNPGSSNLGVGQVLLAVLMPATYTGFGRDGILAEWVSRWEWVDNCPSWDQLWFLLFARAAKYTPREEFDWASVLPLIFDRLLASFQLPVDGGRAPSRHWAGRANWLMPPQFVRKFAVASGKLVVRLLDVDVAGGSGAGPKSCIALLEQLTGVLSTFCHPSNYGRWSSSLGQFLGQLCYAFAQRFGRERATSTGEVKEGAINGISAPATPIDVRTRFIDAVLPLVHLGLYSRVHAMTSSAASATKHLASVAPAQVAAIVVPFVERALDPSTLTETHLAPAAMSLLAIAAGPLLYPRPHLAPVLPSLLHHALPGVDPNDDMKTMAALAFFCTIVSSVPLVDATGSETPSDRHGVVLPPAVSLADGAGPPSGEARPRQSETDGMRATLPSEAETLEDGELYQAAWEATGPLSEWALLFLDRLFKLFEAREKPSKSAQFSPAAQLSAMRGSQLELFLNVFFDQMSPSLRTRAANKVYAWASTHTTPNASKDVANLLKVIGRSCPDQALSKFVPFLHAQITSSGSGEAVMEWSILMLDGLVRRAGENLLAALPAVTECVEAGAQSGHKSARKAAFRLLRHSLRALTETYILEYASESSLSAPLLWTRWGSPTSWDPESLGARWHVPSKEEVAAANDLVVRFVEEPLAEVESLLAAPQSFGDGGAEESKGAETASGSALSVSELIRRRMPQIIQGMRGAAPLLPTFPGDDGDQHIIATARGVVSGHRGTDEPLRERLAKFASRGVSYVLEHRPTDVKAANLFVKLAFRVMCTRGIKNISRRTAHSYVTGLKRRLRNRAFEAEARALTGGRSQRTVSASRHLVLRRVESQHQCRVTSAIWDVMRAAHGFPRGSSAQLADYPWEGSFSDGRFGFISEREATYNEVNSSLMAISSQHHFADARTKAQGVLHATLAVMPWTIRQFVANCLDMLAVGKVRATWTDSPAPKITHPSVTGAVHMLHNHQSWRRIASDGRLLDRFLKVMMTSDEIVEALPADRRENASARINGLFASFVQNWDRTPIALAHKGREKLEQHAQTFDFLLVAVGAKASASGGAGGGTLASYPIASTLHWRQQLFAAAGLSMLLRRDAELRLEVGSPAALDCRVSAMPQLWNWVASGIASSSVPLRKMCLNLLSTMCYMVAKDNNQDDAALSGVKDLLAKDEFLTVLLDAVSHDHVESATSADGRSGAINVVWSAGVKELVSGFPPLPRLENLARTASEPSSFAQSHAELFTHLFGLVGIDRLLPLLLPHLYRLLDDNDGLEGRSHHATTAEVVAGALRACTIDLAASGPVNFTESDADLPRGLDESAGKLWPGLLSVLRTGFSSGSLEWTDDWVHALRYACARRAPQELASIVKLVFSNVTRSLSPVAATIESVLSGDEATSAEYRKPVYEVDSFAQQARWLKLLHPMIIEFSCHTAEAAQDAAATSAGLVELLLGTLAHPYKLCREEIARTLFLLCSRAVSHSTYTSDRAASGLREPEAWVASAAAAALAVVEAGGLAGASSPTIGDADSRVAAERTKCRDHARETVSYWISVAASVSDGLWNAQYVVPLLKILLTEEAETNAELSAVARHARATVGRCLHVSTSVGVRIDGGDLQPAVEATVACIARGAKSSVWRTRQAALELLGQFRARHLFVLPVELNEKLLAVVTARLRDAQTEVQETAQSTLVGFLMTLPDDQQVELAQPFLELVATKVPRKPTGEERAAAKDDPEALAALQKRAKKHSSRLKKRHAGALGLGALVLAHPYDVPAFLPDVLVMLSKCNADPVPVSTTVRNVFTKFKRTHHDNWEEHKLQFTPEQLSDLVDLLVSPTYYA